MVDVKVVAARLVLCFIRPVSKSIFDPAENKVYLTLFLVAIFI